MKNAVLLTMTLTLLPACGKWEFGLDAEKQKRAKALAGDNPARFTARFHTEDLSSIATLPAPKFLPPDWIDLFDDTRREHCQVVTPETIVFLTGSEPGSPNRLDVHVRENQRFGFNLPVGAVKESWRLKLALTVCGLAPLDSGIAVYLGPRESEIRKQGEMKRGLIFSLGVAGGGGDVGGAYTHSCYLKWMARPILNSSIAEQSWLPDRPIELDVSYEKGDGPTPPAIEASIRDMLTGRTLFRIPRQDLGVEEHAVSEEPWIFGLLPRKDTVETASLHARIEWAILQRL